MTWGIRKEKDLVLCSTVIKVMGEGTDIVQRFPRGTLLQWGKNHCSDQSLSFTVMDPETWRKAVWSGSPAKLMALGLLVVSQMYFLCFDYLLPLNRLSFRWDR